MKRVVKTMKALSDPTRIKIIKMLEIKEMCVCEIQGALDLAQPTVSKHLKVLEEVELVERRKEGLWVNYRLPEKPESALVSVMLENMAGWLNDDREIYLVKKKVGSMDRLKICKQS